MIRVSGTFLVSPLSGDERLSHKGVSGSDALVTNEDKDLIGSQRRYQNNLHFRGYLLCACVSSLAIWGHFLYKYNRIQLTITLTSCENVSTVFSN